MAAWLSTSLAAIGVGLGFRAMFSRLDPPWIPRLVASLFLVLAVLISVTAEKRACKALDRMSNHMVEPPSSRGIRYSAYGVAAGALVLLLGIWFFYD